MLTRSHTRLQRRLQHDGWFTLAVTPLARVSGCIGSCSETLHQRLQCCSVDTRLIWALG